MEQTLILQNPQWNGKPFKRIVDREVMNNLREKYDLPFTLLSDASTQMLQAFGAWGEKKMYGKTVMGTIRRTFIFDEDGILERIIEKVDTKNHAAQILD